MNCSSNYGGSFNETLQKVIGDYSFVQKMKKCDQKDIDKFFKKE